MGNEITLRKNGTSNWYVWMFKDQVRKLPVPLNLRVENTAISRVVRVPINTNDEKQMVQRKFIENNFSIGKIQVVANQGTNTELPLVSIQNNACYPTGLVLTSSNIPFQYEQLLESQLTTPPQVISLLGTSSSSFLERVFYTYSHPMIRRPTYQGNREFLVYGPTSQTLLAYNPLA